MSEIEKGMPDIPPLNDPYFEEILGFEKKIAALEAKLKEKTGDYKKAFHNIQVMDRGIGLMKKDMDLMAAKLERAREALKEIGGGTYSSFPVEYKDVAKAMVNIALKALADLNGILPEPPDLDFKT